MQKLRRARLPALVLPHVDVGARACRHSCPPAGSSGSTKTKTTTTTKATTSTTKAPSATPTPRSKTATRATLVDGTPCTTTAKACVDIADGEAWLLDDVAPNHISWSGIQRVLQNLLKERVSIRDLTTIVEAISEAAPSIHDAKMLADRVHAVVAATVERLQHAGIAELRQRS